jgi:hypothetical protein
MAGNELDTYNSVTNPFSFTTKDITAPTVTSCSPQNQAENVLCSVEIKITFSEGMDESSVEDAISVPFSFTESWSGFRLTLTPDSDLDFSTQYEISIGTGAEDLAGNNLKSKYTFSFTTEEEDVNHAPEVAVSSPSNDDADESITIEWLATDLDGDSVTISLYYDTDTDDSVGLKLIKGGLGNSGSYDWDTSDLPEGDYYVFVKASDGVNEAGSYSGKLTIAHAEVPDDGGNQDGVDPGADEESDSFPMLILILIIIIVVIAVLVAALSKGSKKTGSQAETITCPRCGKQFTADTSVSPYVQCPFCGTSGMMK